MDKQNIDKMKELMRRENFDAIVAITPENVLYSTGSYIITQKFLRDRLGIAVFPLEGDPVFIVCSIEESLAREESWISDIRTYVEFQESPIDFLADVLEELQVNRGSIGMELDYLSVKYWEQFQKRLPDAKVAECKEIFSDVKMIKTAKEIELLAKGARVTRKAVEAAFITAKPGDSEKKIANAIMKSLIEQGADEVPFAVFGSGDRTMLVHPFALEEKPVVDGDFIRIDVGGLFSGYYSDLARTVGVGSPDREKVEVYKKLSGIQKTVIENAHVGKKISDLYHLCANLYAENGLDFKMPHIGHGLGTELHEKPVINPLNHNLLEENMILNVEPLVFFKGTGFHVEDLILISADGPQVLTGATLGEEMFIIN